MSIEVKTAYLVHTALDERGDMVVIDSKGSTLSYVEFKKQCDGIRLAFPSHDAARKTPSFEVWTFQRPKDGSSLLLCRSKIAGTSHDNRPLPVFEIFRLEGTIGNEVDFLKVVNGLSFTKYPSVPPSGKCGVRRPDQWITLSGFKYSQETSTWNRDRKEHWRESLVKNWDTECQDCVDKLLWFACNRKSCKTGISLCFTADAFDQYDVCMCYTDRWDVAFAKYRVGELSF
jgi:hypothetical protein